MKAFQGNAKPSLEILMDRSDWGIGMISGHYRRVTAGRASYLCFVYYRAARRSEEKAEPEREWCVYSESVIS